VQVQGVSTSFPAQVVGEQGLPGVIVVQEWWGINQQIKDLANRLAFCGYRTLIPDLVCKYSLDFADCFSIEAKLELMLKKLVI
jgi:dienelactone hydrolase